MAPFDVNMKHPPVDSDLYLKLKRAQRSLEVLEIQVRAAKHPACLVARSRLLPA